MTKKYRSSTSEELKLGIDNLAASEEHLVEVAGKTDNEELKQDCRLHTDKRRKIRQNLAQSASDILFSR